MRFSITLLTLAVAGCNSEIYLHDGVTDGDTFYLAQRALVDDDPVLQSWVAYSLAKSTCQLQIGGANPARASSFECEFTARRILAESWFEKTSIDPEIKDPYLDDLERIRSAGYLDEYVARYYRKTGWDIPDDTDAHTFRHWQRRQLRSHKAQTRIIGSWNYARKVRPH